MLDEAFRCFVGIAGADEEEKSKMLDEKAILIPFVDLLLPLLQDIQENEVLTIFSLNVERYSSGRGNFTHDADGGTCGAYPKLRISALTCLTPYGGEISNVTASKQERTLSPQLYLLLLVLQDHSTYRSGCLNSCQRHAEFHIILNHQSGYAQP